MQKVLLASTALVMTTGWAMADVTNAGDGVGASITLSGVGKMGVVGDNEDGRGTILIDRDADGEFDEIDLGDRDADLRFFTDIDLTFEMIGQTDGGLEFGASIDLDESDDLAPFTGDTQGGETIWLRGAFGNLYMGDTDGAFDWAMEEALIGGAIADVNEHQGYSGNAGLDGFYDGQVARYDFVWGGFGVGVSAELDDYDEGDPILGLGAKYTFAGLGFDLTVGGGVQHVNDIGDRARLFVPDDVGMTIWGASANAGFGAIRAVANYSHLEYDGFDEADNGTHWGVALGYETGPWLFAANYGRFDDFVEIGFDDPQGNTFVFGDAEGAALTANYDLGGGAALQGAISFNDTDEEFGFDDESFIQYSFGVAMNF